MENPRIIAFYLPQFHPIPENDEWWGKGFTEWTNVGKAKPLFKGHYQPRIPADLGYYDLRVPEVREEQVVLAKEAGIEGFCYWHYWFGNGKQLIERPFNEVIDTGQPDFPFCLGWANHSWYAKTWDSNGNDKLLIEQLYNDCEDHFIYLLRAFKDSRYIKYENKPLLIVFDAKSLPVEYMNHLNEKAKDNGFNGICFIGISKNESEYNLLRKMGYSFFTPERISNVSTSKNIFIRRLYQLKNLLLGKPVNCFTYKEAIPYFTNSLLDSKEDVIPMLIPQWDHSPRSAGKGLILHKSSPKLFKKHIEDVFQILKKKDERFVFLKSWNEWAEGNYMEPDLKWGKQYLNVLRESIANFQRFE
jgi:hypothetical protein